MLLSGTLGTRRPKQCQILEMKSTKTCSV
uniref:Uncharacterized protein n=1 Tax=Arundo donax TaxID=35708 RepID=A0A0A9HHU3_ARUDO